MRSTKTILILLKCWSSPPKFRSILQVKAIQWAPTRAGIVAVQLPWLRQILSFDISQSIPNEFEICKSDFLQKSMTSHLIKLLKIQVLLFQCCQLQRTAESWIPALRDCGLSDVKIWNRDSHSTQRQSGVSRALHADHRLIYQNPHEVPSSSSVAIKA